LDYGGARSRGAYVPRTPLWVQFALGMAAPFIGVVGFWSLALAMRAEVNVILTAAAVGFISVFVIGAVARARFGWRGFLPGALTGIGLALLAVGLCFAIVCAS
jgi:hypothetical protein